MSDIENNKKSAISEAEQKVLDFWNENKIFEKSLDKKGEDFVFFDGPPFATGTPHYGHILAGVIKDAIPRYQTMRGKHVPRKWGWDCHGLPIENLIEKDLGLKTKQDIEDMGIDKFNEAAHGSVLRYEEYWKEFVPRIGRWVDMEDDYKTMDWKYTESVWWVFNELYNKGLIYEGHKAMHLCPRCETTLANFEVNQGYKDIKDISVTVKFELIDDMSDENFVAKKAETDEEIKKCFEIRNEVFVDEQGFSASVERDEFDKETDTRHFFVSTKDGQIIGTCRIRPKDGANKIGRMAIVKKFRGKGAGKVLVNFILNNLEGNFFCESQEHAIGFYEKLGFASEGERFEEAGETHQKMVYTKTFVLAWTTTPWTLPGNVALAVNQEIDYVKVKQRPKEKKVFLISGKHACASNTYYPKLKTQLEKEGFDVTIIDHVESSSPILVENIAALEKYDFGDAHVITHSLGASTFLKFLEGKDVKISSLTMIAPSYPGKSFSTNPDWAKNSGYNGFELDFEKVKLKIKKTPDIIYSNDDSGIRKEHFLLLGKKLNTNLYKEEDKGHFFGREYTNNPDFQITFSDKSVYILAKSRLPEVFKDTDYEIIEELKGSDLIGLKYKPVFPCTEKYVKDSVSDQLSNAFKIYGADFVTTEDGTGIVHIAPAFGEDDMRLGRENDLPFVQHVGMDGKIKPWITCLKEGLYVKPKDTEEDKIAHMRTDIEVIKWLQENNKFFSKTNITHSYPHCWRCETPLLNYATSSWFVDVPKIKDKLIENNKQINWVPANIKEGRFGKWLEGARDWAISRTRYWGAPLPIWKCQTGKSEIRNPKSETNSNDKKLNSKNIGCGEVKSIGSIKEVQGLMRKSGNKYFVMRHGEAEQNVSGIIDSKLNDGYAPQLSERGKKQVAASAEKLKKEGVDLIFTSPFERTKATAEAVAEVIGFDKSKIVEDKRIEETDVGTFNGKKSEEYHAYFTGYAEKFTKRPPEGENLIELKDRMMRFLEDIDSKYENKNILIVSHEYPVWMLFAGAKGLHQKETIAWKEEKGDDFITTGELMKLDFSPFPHNKEFEMDLHRPYIDGVKIVCSCGGEMERIPDVFDCWFESGSMPYGQAHYPFENKEEFEKNFPAEFIAEGLDQTRGWFYTLLVLSTALFGTSAYKNVVVNGMLLAEDGKKISKSLKNYPDPMDIVNKYGADALRYYLLSSPAVRGEGLSFSEKGVDEVYKKIILRLKNVVSFYEMYSDSHQSSDSRLKAQGSTNVLDQWILARLSVLQGEVTSGLDNYELDKATRPIMDFIDDLSTWYVRRSRDRFKVGDEDSKQALATTRFVLLELSKVIAPFMPFMAEEVWHSVQGVGYSDEDNSVHLEKWGLGGGDLKVDDGDALNQMKEVRNIVSLGLEVRAKGGLKVRQPIALLKIKSQISNLKDNDGLLKLIKDEVNVKEIIFDEKIPEEVELDTELTPELISEGMMRDLTRSIQSLRKKLELTPQEKVTLVIDTDEKGQEFIKKFEEEIKKGTDTAEIEFATFSSCERSELEEKKYSCGAKADSGARPEPVEWEDIKVEELIFKIKINK